MNEYIIYLTDGRDIQVFADNFDVDYTRERVKFCNKNSVGTEENTAVFMLNNIYGFKEEDTE